MDSYARSLGPRRKVGLGTEPNWVILYGEFDGQTSTCFSSYYRCTLLNLTISYIDLNVRRSEVLGIDLRNSVLLELPTNKLHVLNWTKHVNLFGIQVKTFKVART